MIYPYLFWLPWGSFVWTVSPNSIPHNFLVPSTMKYSLLWMKRGKRTSTQGITGWGWKSSVKAEVIPAWRAKELSCWWLALQLKWHSATRRWCTPDLTPLITNFRSEGSMGSSVRLAWVRCRVLLPTASDTNTLHVPSPPQTFPMVCALSCLIPTVLGPWQHIGPHNPCGALTVGCLSYNWQLSKTEKAAQMRNACFSAQHGWDQKRFQFQLENQSL